MGAYVKKTYKKVILTKKNKRTRTKAKSKIETNDELFSENKLNQYYQNFFYS